ncbi:MAG: hypothetical protein GKR94_26775 [Gammaproteobacteria bacterium]|nr:hypothetical protein [Gammaproteobacteria bacterium]
MNLNSNNLNPDNGTIVRTENAQSFFESAIITALAHQEYQASESTVCYIAKMLTRFTRSEQWYECTQEGMRAPVLAFLYGQANVTTCARERCSYMRRLGDAALFRAGIFADSFERKLIGVDYCISMGTGAYGYLAQTRRAGAPPSRERAIFDELMHKFSQFVDVLNEICEKSAGRSNKDLLRLYERWLRTGSARCANQLRALGIQINKANTSLAWQ